MSTFKLKFDESAGERRKLMGHYSEWKQFCVLQQSLEPGAGDLSVEDAARQLYAMLPTRAVNRNQEYAFSINVLDIAEQIPYSHSAQDKFVGIITRLAKTDKLSYLVKDGDYASYFSMRALRQEIYEHSEPIEGEPVQYSNLVGFLARLATARVWPGLFHIVVQLRDFLEEPYGMGDSNAIICTSIWMLFAGHYIFREVVCDPAPLDEETERLFRRGKQYDGPIFGIERWRYWQTTLAAQIEAGGVDINEEAQNLGRKAVDIMAATDRNMTF
ncbi:hypothetical protein BJX99DRAFT_256067 [Aspergillus californicus]